MLTFPNCKINLGLRILRKRADGFHDLETVFYPIPLKDALEIINDPEIDSASGTRFSMSGTIHEIPTEDNICLKAYHILQKDFPQLAAVKMHLHKTIPAGAGLGGGSADGAFALKMLNEKFNLGLNSEQLKQYALQLGSDCPFFIINKPCVATGRGEILEKINLDLSNYKFVLVNPNMHVSTAWAYSNVTPALPKRPIKEIIQQPIETWATEMINDFESPVFRNFTEIKNIKENLYKSDALFAGMSGSGSTVFGIFKKETITSFSFPSHYFIKELFSELH